MTTSLSGTSRPVSPIWRRYPPPTSPANRDFHSSGSQLAGTGGLDRDSDYTAEGLGLVGSRPESARRPRSRPASAGSVRKDFTRPHPSLDSFPDASAAPRRVVS